MKSNVRLGILINVPEYKDYLVPNASSAYITLSFETRYLKFDYKVYKVENF